MTETLDNGMQCSKFVVHDEPWCVWEWDLSERNLEFIENLAPDYFEHLAGVHFQETEGERGVFAAIAIRLGYGQALEAFFALLFAALQAPDCVPGWLSRYKLHQLRALVDAISSRAPIRTKVKLAEVSWQGVANVLLSFRLPDEQRDTEVKRDIARLWARFASDLLDAQQSKEYNAIKHGLRVRPGGFILRRGREEAPGVAPPPTSMKTVAASRFGCSMLLPEPVGSEKSSFRIRHLSRNWDVENLTNGLVLLSESMRNVLSFLRIANGVDPSQVPFSWPEDLNELRQPWRRSVGFSSWNMDAIIRPEDIITVTPPEIFRIYDEAVEEGCS